MQEGQIYRNRQILVPLRGLEPLTLAGLAPKASAYSNSATGAKGEFKFSAIGNPEFFGKRLGWWR